MPYDAFLAWSPMENREGIFKLMQEIGISSSHSVALMIQTYFELGSYQESSRLILEFVPIDDDQRMIVKLFEGYCKIELNSLEEAKSNFQSLIESDLTHSLGYAQYFGAIICYIGLGEFEKAKKHYGKDQPNPACDIVPVFAVGGES